MLQELFPHSRILLCHFHVLKWIKKIIATVPKEMSVRKELFHCFKKMMYAPTESDFEEQYKKWNELAEDIEVRVSSVKDAPYVNLKNYFFNNWMSCVQMWATFERKNLPIASDNTTNRVERSFGVLKYTLRMNNRKNIPMESAVCQVIKWAEGKLEERKIEAERKQMNIHHEDPVIKAEYEEAAKVLNRSGCLAFKRSIEIFKKHEKKLSISPCGGVDEVYRSSGDLNFVKNYQSDDHSCSCTFWRKNQHVCRHIILVRKVNKLPLFSAELFSDYYFKLDSISEAIPPGQVSTPIDIVAPCSSSDEEEAKDVPFNENEKFRIAQNSCSAINDLLPKFGTKEFIRYMWELEIIRNRLRRGEPMLQDVAIEDGGHDENPEEPSKTCKTETDVGKLDEALQKEVDWLKFEKSLRRKGRPRKGKNMKAWKKNKQDQGRNDRLPVFTEVATESAAVTTPKLEGEDLDIIRISPSEEEASSTQVANNQDKIDKDKEICALPPFPYQVCDNAITYKDFGTLTEKQYISDCVFNWWLKLMDIERSVDEVELLSTLHYQNLDAWIPGTPLDKTGRLYSWGKNLNGFVNDKTLMIIPGVWRRHYYVLVCVLDPSLPTVYVLESFGGSYACLPPQTQTLCSLLAVTSEESGILLPAFEKVVLEVPRQPMGSNNCGIFAIEYIERIVSDPQQFIHDARGNNLANWFDPHSLDTKRVEISARISQAAETQQMGCPNSYVQLPLPTPSSIFRQVLSSIFITLVLLMD